MATSGKQSGWIRWPSAGAAVLAWVALGGWVLPAHAMPTIEFGVLDVAPFAVQSEGQPLSGLYVELLRAIQERAGVNGGITPYPLARVLSKLEDGSLGATLAIANARILEIAEPVAEVVRLHSVVIGGRQTRVGAFEDLHDRNVCLLRGASFDPRLFDDPRIRRTEMPDYGACITMLRAGRVDFIAAPRVAISWLLRSGALAATDIGEPFVLSERPVQLLVSRRLATPARMKALADAVQRARADGSIAAILKRYGQ